MMVIDALALAATLLVLGLILALAISDWRAFGDRSHDEEVVRRLERSLMGCEPEDR